MWKEDGGLNASGECSALNDTRSSLGNAVHFRIFCAGKLQLYTVVTTHMTTPRSSPKHFPPPSEAPITTSNGTPSARTSADDFSKASASSNSRSRKFPCVPGKGAGVNTYCFPGSKGILCGSPRSAEWLPSLREAHDLALLAIGRRFSPVMEHPLHDLNSPSTAISGGLAISLNRNSLTYPCTQWKASTSTQSHVSRHYRVLSQELQGNMCAILDGLGSQDGGRGCIRHQDHSTLGWVSGSITAKPETSI